MFFLPTHSIVAQSVPMEDRRSFSRGILVVSVDMEFNKENSVVTVRSSTVSCLNVSGHGRPQKITMDVKTTLAELRRIVDYVDQMVYGERTIR